MRIRPKPMVVRTWAPGAGCRVRTTCTTCTTATAARRRSPARITGATSSAAGPPPALIPPATVGVVPAQQADLHPAAGAMDEAAVAEVESHVRHRAAPVGEGQQVTRRE